ncbi:MAG: PA2169 family four-helix-bundle protein [Phycisphaerales bacterium]|nr:PA2169 family four-helix-bundle protein [Phycisphaerales bacterium]
MNLETTTTLSRETLDGVQSLITANIDSGKGFASAAEQIENKDIASYFRRCGMRREAFANELQRIVGVNGETPTTSGSVTGTARRWWLDLRGTIQNGDEHAVLAEAERAEDAAKARYEKVLKHTAGSPLNELLHRQYASVKQDHDTIRDMRDARA